MSEEESKKVVTRRQPAKAKINIKTEAQKKEASSVAPTMLSKLWQQVISFQVMAVLTASSGSNPLVLFICSSVISPTSNSSIWE